MPQHARINAFAVGLLAIVTIVMAEPASALTASAGTLQHQLRQDSPVVEVAGTPPAPGYCWYYTDPSRTQGFWDVCP